MQPPAPGTKPEGRAECGGRIVGDGLWGRAGLLWLLSKECLESGVWGRLTWRQRAGWVGEGETEAVRPVRRLLA